jgi:uncharacterized protein with ParB-like and HNH nuclease domain
MQAAGTNFKTIIEGTKQFLVPLFQRTYVWTDKDVKALWRDVEELYGAEPEATAEHFIGSFVTMPDDTTPTISRFILIDGQQRMTTLLLFLAAIRQVAIARQEMSLAEEIEKVYLSNPYATGFKEKFLPTKGDRAEFTAAVTGVPSETPERPSMLRDAFKLAMKLVTGKDDAGQLFDLQRLKDIFITSLSLVSITLSSTDDPYVIFQSLNGTGVDLTQADLIRNYFLMRLPVPLQEQIYDDTWLPMQNGLNMPGQLPDFFRHFLSKDGGIVNLRSLYSVLKARVDKECKTAEALEAYLITTAKFAKYYRVILNPQMETDPSVRKRLHRLDEWVVTVSHPLLLNLYRDYAEDRITAAVFAEMLTDIESFVVRRFFCGFPTNQLNKVFVSAYRDTNPEDGGTPDQRLDLLRQYFLKQDWPNDARFKEGFRNYALYKDKQHCQMVLRLLEVAQGYKEVVEFESLTVEHIMPQTLTPAWEAMLGADAAQTHSQWQHTVGNLTLTAYNSTLSNGDFPTKQGIYANSNVTLNSYFAPLTKWTESEIIQRGDYLAAQAAQIWERP